MENFVVEFDAGQANINPGPARDSEVPLPPQLGIPSRFTEDAIKFEYTVYTIDTEYVEDTGLRVLASGGIDGTQNQGTVTRIHRGMTRKVVKWVAERINKMPILPSKNTQNPNEVLISSLIYPANPVQGAIGIQKLYRVSGVYVYDLVKPMDENSIYPMGTTPGEMDVSADHNITPQNFSPDVLDASHAIPQGLQLPLRVS